MDAMDAMDAISALDTAACILAITEFITELLSTSQISKAQPPLSPDGKDEHAILETLEKLRIALSDIQIPSVPQQPSASAFRPLSNALAQRALISSRDASAALLEDIESILRRSPDEPRSQPWGTDTRAWLRSRLAGTLYIEKLGQLSHAVTRQVSCLLRWVVQIPSSRLVFLFFSFFFFPLFFFKLFLYFKLEKNSNTTC
jgi:hypothetical protein